MNDGDRPTGSSADNSIDGMMQHLEEAKKLNKDRAKKRSQPRLQGLQKKMAARSDTAVLASNYPTRLEELVEFEAVTHRSSKGWVSAKVAVDSHGSLPIYYRQDGVITHTGVITRLILDPEPDSQEAQAFLDHISESDTYNEHSDELDTTTYIVEHGQELDEPFSQTELIKVSNNEPIDEGYSRQPAFVFQREGDFPSSK